MREEKPCREKWLSTPRVAVAGLPGRRVRKERRWLLPDPVRRDQDQPVHHGVIPGRRPTSIGQWSVGGPIHRTPVVGKASRRQLDGLNIPSNCRRPLLGISCQRAPSLWTTGTLTVQLSPAQLSVFLMREPLKRPVPGPGLNGPDPAPAGLREVRRGRLSCCGSFPAPGGDSRRRPGSSRSWGSGRFPSFQ